MKTSIRRFVRREHGAPASLKKVLVRALLKPVQILAPFVVSFAAVSALVGAGVIPQIGVNLEPNRPTQTQDLEINTAETIALDLVEEHGCWTGEAPKDMEGKMPGHVVTQKGLGGQRVVGKALDQIFNGTDHGLTVYGFCR